MNPTKQIESLINFKLRSPGDVFSLLLFRDFYFKKRISEIAREQDSGYVNHPAEPLKLLEVSAYMGNNPYVIQMKNYLRSHLAHDLKCAFVHGSLGTGDEIAYSDFDALVVIANEVVSDPSRLKRVVNRLSDARIIMLRFDPLQHHGWFVLTESDLKQWNDAYLPHTILSYAKSLLTDSPCMLEIQTLPDPDFRTPFYNQCDGLLRILENEKKINSLYVLKSVFSRFMLLPALYYRAKYKRGIFKKASFDEVKKEFTPAQWEVMDEVSELRQKWNPAFRSLQKKLLAKYYFLSHKILRPFYPSFDEHIRKKIESGLFRNMHEFVILLRSKV